MKIQKCLTFVPRGLPRVRAEGDTAAPPPRDNLRRDNPFIPRATDVLHVTAEFAEHALPEGALARLHRPLQVAHGAAAVGATLWGVNKLVQGQTWQDKVEAAASLSLAGESALAASGASLPGIGLALGLIHGSGEIITGGSDLWQGWQANSPRRALAGGCQMLTGAGALASKLIPGAGLWGHSMMMVGMLGRQAAIASSPE